MHDRGAGLRLTPDGMHAAIDRRRTRQIVLPLTIGRQHAWPGWLRVTRILAQVGNVRLPSWAKRLPRTPICLQVNPIILQLTLGGRQVGRCKLRSSTMRRQFTRCKPHDGPRRQRSACRYSHS